tara:strand:- start:2478 stop:3671 length:1194 start_codon:yes stop_codon:yes gene_type:complete
MAEGQMTTRVKLVAIAKDEAAYLPDWIFHHLHFGFDSIDVYVNNTTDNTWELAKLLEHEHRVSFIDADCFFQTDVRRPQEEAYQDAYLRYVDSEFTHLMFLDIDEFWTPKNFEDSIHDCLRHINSDVISFEWVLRQSESISFSEPFETKVDANKSLHVKSIFSLESYVENINVHNVYAPSSTFKLADGSVFTFQGRNNAEIPKSKGSAELKDYFILHRMFRSQMEYVSLLGRGRPSNEHSLKSRFKNNRAGYCVFNNNVTFIPNKSALSNYMCLRQAFYNDHVPQHYIDDAQQFVKNRFHQVNRMIKKSPSYEVQALDKVLKNVTLEETVSALNNWKKFIVSAEDVDFMRDAALKLESSDPVLAYKLMSIAQKKRPEGTLIKSRIKHYREKLKLRFL